MALITVTATSAARIVSVLVKAFHPVVPDAVVNSRARREKKSSTGPLTSPIRTSSGVCTGDGAYHARLSAAIKPNAAAKMKRTLDRKPMVRMGRWLLIGSTDPRLNTLNDGKRRFRVQTRVWHSVVKSAKKRLTSAWFF